MTQQLSKRLVVKPNLEHCKSILARDFVAIPIRQYYNWFLIKYGNDSDGDILYHDQRGSFAHIARYVGWCQQFILENNDDQAP